VRSGGVLRGVQFERKREQLRVAQSALLSDSDAQQHDSARVVVPAVAGSNPSLTCKSVRVPRKGGNENNDANYYNGRTVEVRVAGGHVQYLVVPDDIGNNRVPEWFDEASVKATKRRSSCVALEGKRGARYRPLLWLSLLGREHAAVHLGGRLVGLARRHSEILALLWARPAGITSEDLAAELYGDAGRPGTVPVQIHRLRRLSSVHKSRPSPIGSRSTSTATLPTCAKEPGASPGGCLTIHTEQPKPWRVCPKHAIRCLRPVTASPSSRSCPSRRCRSPRRSRHARFP
jgi:hypothetical protein